MDADASHRAPSEKGLGIPTHPPVRLPRLTVKRLLRSLGLFGRYATVHKARNLISAELAFRNHQVRLVSLPYLYRVDPSSRCTLGCPYCWRFQSAPQKPAQISHEQFVQAFAPFADTCLLVSFQMFGEPTLNEALPEMIHHAHERRCATYVSTNLQQDDPAYLRRLVSSGLDLLTISLDAATPETYAKMKPGGDYHLLTENVRTLFRLKRSATRFPAVGFQVLVTRHNEPEIPAIRSLARGWGADYVDCKSVLFLPDSSWLPEEPRYHVARYRKRRADCSMPWTNITLLSNGRFFPCCAFPGAFDLGGLDGDPVESVWDGEALREIREGFRTGALASLCRACPLARLPRF